jgi:hypothetical protein
VAQSARRARTSTQPRSRQSKSQKIPRKK